MTLIPLSQKSDSHDYQYTQQDIKPILVSKKPPKPEPRLYHGILLTTEDLKRILKEQFDTYGISDKIPQAIYTIGGSDGNGGESGWRWNASNGISSGIASFTPATWNDECKGFGKFEDLNPLMQFSCMAKLWARGEQGRWDVWCTSKYNTNNDWRCSKRGLHPPKGI